MKRQILFLATVLFVLGAILTSAYTSEATPKRDFPTNISNITQPNLAPAKNPAEFKALIANPKANIIRSMADFNSVVTKNTPLRKVKVETLKAFRRSLKFNTKTGGVSSFKFTGLKAQLSPKDYGKVLGMFGLSTTMAADHEGYACVGVGDCASNSTHICTSNC